MSFISISQLFNQTDIFVIPTFQRPYAWEVDPQVQDLLRDVSVATGKQIPFHYFGAIHTIKVKPSDPLWRDYTDPENPDIQRLSACGFRTDTTSLNVHLVVDGQQRLVTLFALLERCLTDSIRYVTLPGGQRLPKLILNPATDHAHWRELLGLDTTTAKVETRSHMRLQAMFAYLTLEAPKPSSKEYAFLIDDGCELMRVQLRSASSLAPFLTLNDRGKDLTRLEKVKSLVLEADENGSYGLAHPINNRFGEIYRSIDQLDSLLGEDEYLRQLSTALWEANGFQAHRESLDNIYLRYREQLSNQPGNAAQLVNHVVSQSAALVDEHNALVKRCSDARAEKPLSCPSYVNALFPQAPARDACDDYQRVIDSLGLQPKQLALLLAVRKHYGIDWHEPLGVMRLSNREIKSALSAEYRTMAPVAENLPEQQIENQVDSLINAIPDDSVRDVTPLYLVEMLRLIVDTSKPGFFNNAWQMTFGEQSSSAQAFLDTWVDYLLSHSSRDNFIVWSIARNPRADNQSPWLKHLLREYECCLPGGGNAHRATNLEIEHFFSSDFSAISSMTSHGFASKNDFKQEFVDRPGNKLMLDASLNRAFKSLLPPLNKLLPYSNGQYGSVQLAPGQFTQSSLEIAAQLPGKPNLATLRTYVMLRQLRLAAFATNRF
jgi:hypothetical protein